MCEEYKIDMVVAVVVEEGGMYTEVLAVEVQDGGMCKEVLEMVGNRN